MQTVVKAVVKPPKQLADLAKKAKKQGFLDAGDDGATVTRLVDDTCIFLNQPTSRAAPGVHCTGRR